MVNAGDRPPFYANNSVFTATVEARRRGEWPAIGDLTVPQEQALAAAARALGTLAAEFGANEDRAIEVGLSAWQIAQDIQHVHGGLEPDSEAANG